MRKNNKDKILSAARRLFLKHGYNGVSLRSIGREARLTTGAVYFHFKSKMDIYRTICQEAIEILTGEFIDGLNKSNRINQKLISTFDSYIRFFYEHSDYYNILMEFKSSYDEDGEKNNGIAGGMSRLTGITQNTIQEGIKSGEFRDINAAMLSLFLACVAEGMLQYKKMGLFEFYGVTDRDFRKFMANVIGWGIQAG